MVKLYDSKTKELKNIDETEISIYNCGPTVYNHIHIGNARPLVTFDVLYRLFIYLNKKVKYVLNITDIDDKIINSAISNNTTELELSDFYANEYFKIRQRLNVLTMINPKVTDNIEGIVEYIDKLVQSKYAYFNDDGDVYFDVSQIKGYGCISHQKLSELESSGRTKIDSNKRNENDFVLWKKTKVGVKWASPWFDGRPGWHSECSYLINKLIGKQVTIHGGGMDLKFPHHENENAQNLALYNCDLAKVWLHIGMININNEKMSKSLNNFILVKDILNIYSYQALRWFFYQSSISNPLNYTTEIMEQMENEISKINKTINKAKNLLILTNGLLEINDKYPVNQNVIDNLSNNLNLINAVTEIYKIVKELNLFINNKDIINVQKHLNELIVTLKLMGIEFIDLHNENNIKLLKKWNEFSINKDFKNADIIRDELIKIGLF